jgi:glucose-6-phosphate 1-dehydrogenase
MEPAMIVLFGSTGDLTRRKLIPALYNLHRKGQLHACTPIVAVGRKPFTDGSFFEHLQTDDFLKNADQTELERFLKRIKYLHLDISSTDPASLKDAIEGLERQYSCGKNKLFYLALPPQIFGSIARLVKPLKGDDGWQRVVFEKPFGQDTSSAEELNKTISEVFQEDEVFRIDHYLGKASVQNILSFRFSNALFEKAWRKEDIERVEIVAAESVGVGTRAGYYDKTGAVLDMVQNHLLQLLSLVAMEPPSSLESDDIRDQTVKVIESLRLGSWRRAQYVAGSGKKGYREEDGVAPDSDTETYASLELFVDSPRWQGVPFILTTGKRMQARHAEIKVFFRRNGLYEHAKMNLLTIRLQPDEGIAFRFNARDPETGELDQVDMDFCHPCHFGPNTAEAYEALLAEVIRGSRTLFTRWDWLLASWKFIDGVVEEKPTLESYPAGKDGPEKR